MSWISFRAVSNGTLIALWLFGGTSRAQQVAMRVIREFPDGYGTCVPGDADHDGRAEIHGMRYVAPNTVDYDVLERYGVNDWALVYRVVRTPGVDDAGDCDRDGRFEILRLSIANGIEIFESTSPSSFPSQIVYANPGIAFYAPPIAFTDDLDRRWLFWRTSETTRTRR